MVTSIDSNAMTLLWVQDIGWSQRASSALEAAARLGPLIVCGPVFAELMGLPGRNPRQLQSLLEASGIQIEWNLGETVWQAAGVAYQDYVQRRKKSGGGLPRRMLTDLLIGAHASVRGYALLSMDQDIYRAAFPDLRLVRF